MTAKEFQQALKGRRRLYGTQIASTCPRIVDAVKGIKAATGGLVGRSRGGRGGHGG